VEFLKIGQRFAKRTSRRGNGETEEIIS